jgi:phage-related protein
VSNILTIINQAGVILAYLNNLESASIHKVINGEYVLNFVALIEPLKTEFLYDEDNLIVYDNDYFKVITLDDEHDDNNMLKVTVSCEHISYDLINQTKLTFTHNNRAAIYVMNDLLLDSGFTFTGTDVTTTASIDIQRETDIKSLLYQVATIWQGEIEYFRKDIALKQHLGQNRGTDFRFGKNIENIRRSIDKVEGTVSYEIDIVQGSELEELGFFDLGDTVRVVDDALNIEIDIRIIDLERDIVTGMNGKVVLGEPIKDLSTNFTSIKKTVNATSDKVNSVVDEHGKLIAEKLSGTLNNAIETVVGQTGYVTFDSRGVSIHNQPTEAESTWVILLTSGGILISNAKDIQGQWVWRTAVTGESISADAITTGTLTAININGVTITGSTIVSESATNKITIDDGTIVIYDKVNVKNLLEASSGNLVVNGFLRTGYTVNATSIDDNGISFHDGSNWASSISGGVNMSIDSVGGLSLSSGLGITLSSAFINVSGNFSVSGMKNCRIETEQFGDVDFSAYETAEIYLGDIGESEVLNGKCIINLDEKLLACTNTDMPYQVFLQAYGDGRVYVTERNKTSFTVKGDNIKFGWEVKAKRKGYENIRFGQPK